LYIVQSTELEIFTHINTNVTFDVDLITDSFLIMMWRKNSVLQYDVKTSAMK